jgi:hypothetical protein
MALEKEMSCRVCGEHSDFLMYVYNNRRRTDMLVCARHWNEMYFNALSEQLVQNE